mgnify:CR=1 FL=1
MDNQIYVSIVNSKGLINTIERFVFVETKPKNCKSSTSKLTSKGIKRMDKQYQAHEDDFLEAVLEYHDLPVVENDFGVPVVDKSRFYR